MGEDLEPKYVYGRGDDGAGEEDQEEEDEKEDEIRRRRRRKRRGGGVIFFITHDIGFSRVQGNGADFGRKRESLPQACSQNPANLAIDLVLLCSGSLAFDGVEAHSLK